ncbi:hypothetical protein [Oceanobacillus kimchii]|uniref:hypothetical protein n=1 Tax=Oceanobacillus kimchii TaxID=746691 RepID=UPI003C7177D5
MSAMTETSKNKLSLTGTIMQLIVLLIISPLVTNWYSDNVPLYFIFIGIITISNVVIEKFSISKKGNNKQNYMLLFLMITIPINLILIIFIQSIS